MPIPKKVPTAPTIKILDGMWFDYEKNLEAPLTQAKWVTHGDQEAFHLSGPAVEGPWSLHLQRKHDEFHGDWIYDGERPRYPVSMRLYCAVHGEEEWILYGTWTEPGRPPLPLSMRLWRDEE